MRNIKAAKEISLKGHYLFKEFLDKPSLEQAQNAAEKYFPRPSESNAEAIKDLRHALPFPFADNALNRIPFDDRLIEIINSVIDSTDIRLTSSFIQAKYGTRYMEGFDQPLHNDAWNASSLLWPSTKSVYQRLYGILYLTDVDELSGPTRISGKASLLDAPLLGEDGWARYLESDFPELYDLEKPVIASAGDLLLFTGDVVHRGTAFRKEDGHRVALFFNFHSASATWTGHHLWASFPGSKEWPVFSDLIVELSVTQREMLGFPPIDSSYWCDETVRGLQRLYPGIDSSAYSKEAIHH